MTVSSYEFEECAACATEYPVVLDIEYTDEPVENGFADACDDPNRPAATILRDPGLVTPGDAE